MEKIEIACAVELFCFFCFVLRSLAGFSFGSGVVLLYDIEF